MAATAVVTLGLAATACSEPDPVPETQPLSPPLPTPVSTAAAADHGTIVSARPVDAPGIGRGQLVSYRSTNGADGAPTTVSGAFFTPAGSPPGGGWPTIVYAHGTTGLTPDCGPTLDTDNLEGYGPVKMLTDRGYAVALIDYQGLGIAGQASGATEQRPAHPYLEPRSAAYNVIDSVRAMRALHPGQISSRWAVAGHSQGGQAAWATAELAQTYGSDLTLVAAMAQAPAVNLRKLSGFADGTYDPSRMWIAPMMIAGLSASRPTIVESHFLRGAVAANLSLLTSCHPADDQRREQAEGSITEADLTPDGPADTDALQQVLNDYTLPQRRASVPIYVAQGTDDQVVPPAATLAAVRQGCNLGDTIRFESLQGKDHDIGGDMGGYDWLYDRMAGKPATSDCPSLTMVR